MSGVILDILQFLCIFRKHDLLSLNIFFTEMFILKELPFQQIYPLGSFTGTNVKTNLYNTVCKYKTTTHIIHGDMTWSCLYDIFNDLQLAKTKEGVNQQKWTNQLGFVFSFFLAFARAS